MRRHGFWLGLGSLFVVALSILDGASAARGTQQAPRFRTDRSFVLAAGRTTRTFTFHERSGVILVNRLTVPLGVRAVATAEILDLAGARVASWPSPADPSLSCRANGPSEVCTQGEEWCPMPNAIWQIRLTKLSGPAGRIRFDYVVAPPPSSN